MTSIFVLGLLFGVRHAFDADHLAAVTALATRSRSARETVRRGLAWGSGHALVLFAAGALVFAMGVRFSGTFASLAELGVGVMLIVLGADVVRRAVKSRMHVHGHSHGEAGYHIHLHAHAGDGPHEASCHHHHHPARLGRRAALVGTVHGLAGSAPLVLLAVGTTSSPLAGLVYMALFALGSMVGMAALSFTIAVPLRSCAHFWPQAVDGLSLTVGLATVVLGGVAMYQAAAAGWLAP